MTAGGAAIAPLPLPLPFWLASQRKLSSSPANMHG